MNKCASKTKKTKNYEKAYLYYLCVVMLFSLLE